MCIKDVLCSNFSHFLCPGFGPCQLCLSRQCKGTACGYACRGGCLLFMAELFRQSAKEKLLVLLGWVQLGSLRYSPDVGSSYLTSPQLRNVLVISHSALAAAAALRDEIQGGVRVLFGRSDLGSPVTFALLQNNASKQLLSKQFHASYKHIIRKMQGKLLNTHYLSRTSIHFLT